MFPQKKSNKLSHFSSFVCSFSVFLFQFSFLFFSFFLSFFLGGGVISINLRYKGSCPKISHEEGEASHSTGRSYPPNSISNPLPHKRSLKHAFSKCGRSKLMTSQRLKKTYIRTGGYGFDTTEKPEN